MQDAFVSFRALRWTLPMLPLLAAIAPHLRLPVRWLSRMTDIANDPALVQVFLRDRLGAGNRIRCTAPTVRAPARPCRRLEGRTDLAAGRRALMGLSANTHWPRR